MDKWLSVSQLSVVTEIPETTVRRYTNKFKKYFRYEQKNRGKRFHPESIEILNRISTLYSEGFESIEIDNVLAKDFPMTIGENEEITNQPPIKSIEKQFNDFRKQQEEFNSHLLQQIEQQQEYIKNSLEKRDRELTSIMNEMLTARKEISSTKKHKKWWQFWKK